jgi:sensor histidine kinase YesM
MYRPVVALGARSHPRGALEARVGRASFAYWAVQLCGWGWHFWWQASGEAIFAAIPFSKAATVWGGICLTEIVITDLLRRLSKWQGWLGLPTRALLIRLTMSVLVLTAIAFAVTVTLSMAAYESPVTAMAQAFYRQLPLSKQLFNQFLNLLATHLTWVAAYFSVALIRHRYHVQLHQARLSESLQAAELRLLKSQLNAHFLFNALNGVRALIADEPIRAQEAVTQLARTLRYTLESGREELVTLARELEMVDDYLALESLRLAERLHIVREIDPRASSVRIPVMLLQALIENAIKHGIAPLREGGTLRIAAQVIDSELRVEVQNPRPVHPGAEISAGVGLKNAARRLELLFGVHASLLLDLSDARRAKATVRLPA